jgi:ribonucleoside-diphosphate reductase beta chain
VFRERLRELMREAVVLEQHFIADCLPVEGVGLSGDDFAQYIDYIADRRLTGVGLEPLRRGVENPLPWLAELMDVRREQNFFEGRVTEYQRSAVLAAVADDEL